MSLSTFFAKKSRTQGGCAISFVIITVLFLFGQVTGEFPITDFTPDLISGSAAVNWIVIVLLVGGYLFLGYKGFIEAPTGEGMTYNKKDDEWPNDRKRA